MTTAEELRALRVEKQIPAKEMVAVIQRLYPKFDKTMLSKCEHGGEYGAAIPRAAMDALYAEFAPELAAQHARVERRKKDRHRHTDKITVRIENEAYAALQQLIKDDGYGTVQAWGNAMVVQYLKSKRWFENRELPNVFDSFEAANAQVRYCHKNGCMYFLPGGYAHCPRCGLSVYEPKEWPDGHITGHTVRGAGKALITCCPHCNYSFCD